MPTETTPALLTERQSAVLRIIRTHVADYGFAPTLQELCEYTRTRSPGSMWKHLAALQKLGLLDRTSGARQITLAGVCPCCGRKLKPARKTKSE